MSILKRYSERELVLVDDEQCCRVPCYTIINVVRGAILFLLWFLIESLFLFIYCFTLCIVFP
jgi:hypothetical protein